MITRLALGWLLLSILLGAAVYFIEMQKVDDYVVNLAIGESGSFMLDSVDRLNSPDPAHRAFLHEKSKEHIIHGHFIALALYNRDRQKIVEVIRPGLQQDVMQPHRDLWREADQAKHRPLFVEKRFAVHVFLPLQDSAGKGTGYLEGIYQVDGSTMSDIQGRIAVSLAQVALVVLVTTVMLYPVIIGMNKDLMRLTADLSHANLGMLKVLGSAVAKRDSDTNIHNYRVTLYAVRLAEAAGLREAEIKSLIKGAFLHDVGKIGISDAILLKPGKLSDDESIVMKSHPRHGADIIGGYDWLQDAGEVVKHHHEKYDGTGYPAGLKGETIPLAARLFTIADIFDALTSRRPYKASLPFREAMAILEQGSGVFHDPGLLAAFSTQAEALYREIGSADDAVLDKMLDDHMRKYFPEV